MPSEMLSSMASVNLNPGRGARPLTRFASTTPAATTSIQPRAAPPPRTTDR